MPITKEELQNLIYRKKQIGDKVVENLRQPTESEILKCKQVVDNLIALIVEKHS